MSAARHTIEFAVARHERHDPGGGRAAIGAFAGAAADSRAVEAEQLFFALPGERVDGFDFAAQAVASGAAGVVVARGRGMPAGRARTPRSSPSTIRAARSAIWRAPSGPNFAGRSSA